MIVVNIFEAKAKLSEYLELAASGERVLICKRNQPVAELRAVPAARTEPRPIGAGKGTFTVPDAFLEPLPDGLLDAFSGLDVSEQAHAPRGSRLQPEVPAQPPRGFRLQPEVPARVAETPADYGTAKKPKRRRPR